MGKIFQSFLLTILLGMWSAVSFAQQVSGTVTSVETGDPLVGVSVLIKGSDKVAAVTDIDGNYTVKAGGNDVLVFNYVGMKQAEAAVKNRKIVNVGMEDSSESLGEVVVTAMGIKRQSQTLTYAAETVGGKDVNNVKSINVLNSLQGKSAGLQITPNSNGAGGATKILFRGNKSINGSNRPLIVVDGVPLMMDITTSQVTSSYGGERDGGDALSTINPDDIASMTLLKGASAAALYGSVAANGAIMITTKSAAAGKVRINVSSNTTIENPMVLPEFQTTYGGNADGTFSWGDKLATESPNYVKDFYRTGYTLNNSVSLAGGTENISSYFSYGNIYSKGIMPENDYRSHNLLAKVGFNTFNNKLHIDFSAQFNNSHVRNKPAAGYLWNALTGAYLVPRGTDWDYYKNNFEKYDASRGINVQNWTNLGLQQFSNPYWVLNRQTPISDQNHYNFGGSVRYDIITGLNVQGRLRYERGEDHWVHNAYASSVADLYPMGRMKDNRYFSDQLYGDIMVNFNRTFAQDYSVNATVGSSFTKSKTSHVDLWGEGSKYVSPGVGNIYYPNIFTPNNYYGNLAILGKNDAWNTEKQINSVFGTLQLGYKEAAFIDFSARNDWSSTLSFTDNVSFFYPSVGASVLFNRFFNMGNQVDLFKLRATYSIVGNDVPIYMTNLLYSIQSQGAITQPENAPFRTLKPEKTYSFEVGFDGEFLQNRLTLGLTYYKTNTKNQFFSVSAPFEAGLRNRYVNAGNVQNQGFEATAGWRQQFGADFTWMTNLNFSYNDNKIIELVEGLSDELTLTDFGGAKIILKKGGRYGDLYVRTLERNEDGSLKVVDGKPVVGSDSNQDMKKVGNMNAKVNMGWSNTFYYKDFSLSFLIDAKFGGKVVSMTEAALDGWGVSKRSAEARDLGYVMYDGVKFDPEAWYTTVGNSNYNSPYWTENYVYDATNVRLREMSFGYTFRNLFGSGKNLTAQLIARNLFFFYKDAPMDPDVSASTNNGMQGVDMFALPTSRSFGLNLKLNF